MHDLSLAMIRIVNQLDATTNENVRLREEIRALRAAVEDVDAKATREGAGEWVEVYSLPAGPWHRLLGLVRGAPNTAQEDETTEAEAGAAETG